MSRQGFSLLELSVVLLIIGLVTAMAATSGVAVVASARQSATENKMAILQKALFSFRSSYNRLPCPADLTIAEGATNFGVEGATPGTCIGGTPHANFSGAGTTNTGQTGIEGAVPVATLGLPNDFMYDGWGHRIRYAVDSSATATNSFSSISTACTNLALTINDSNGNARSSGAIYALISNGEMGHGGYNKQGVISSAGSTNVDDLANCHCDSSAAATTYSPTYVQKDFTTDPTVATNRFDDIVLYQERWQLMTAWEKPASCTPDVFATTDWAGGAKPFYFFKMSGNNIIETTSTLTTIGGNPVFSPDNSLLLNAQVYSSTQVFSVAADGVTLAGPTTTLATTQNDAFDPVFSPDGGYLAIPLDTAGASPWVYSYSGGIFTKIGNAPVTAGETNLEVALDTNANHLIIGTQGNGTTAAHGPRIFKRNGTVFSELTSQPDVPFTDTNVYNKIQIVLSPDGGYLYATDTTDSGGKFFRAYTISGDTYTYISGQPAVQPAMGGGPMTVDPTNTYIAFASGQGSSPWMYIYKRTGTTFTQLSGFTQPAGNVEDIKFTSSGNYLGVVVANSPYFQVYKVNASSDTFTLLSAPSPIPPSTIGFLATTR